MADIVVTAASVLAGTNAIVGNGTAGATITAGQTLYLDSTTGTIKLADADLSAADANCIGIALHAALANQPIKYIIEDDDFTPGATLSLSVATVKGAYVLSATAGGIAPAADLATAMYPVFIGVVKSTTKMRVKIVSQITAALTA